METSVTYCKPTDDVRFEARTSLAEPTCAPLGEVLMTQEFSKRPDGRNRQAKVMTTE